MIQSHDSIVLHKQEDIIMAIKFSSELAIGDIVYLVYGGRWSYADMKYSHLKQVIEVIILSNPVRTTTETFYIKIKKFNSDNNSDSIFLTDFGITDGLSKVYNLNRMFKTKEEATKFSKECALGLFSDPIDIEFAHQERC